MTAADDYDVAVIGGGVTGCATALHLARGGMRAVVVERRGLCMEASGVNAGSLCLQIKPLALMPYALGAMEMWRTTGKWLGNEVGFQAKGSLMLAFSDDDAELLETRIGERRRAGAPIEILGPDAARRLEPALSRRPVLASHCPIDGFADPTQIGHAYGAALAEAGVDTRLGLAVDAIDRDGGAFTVAMGEDRLRARRIVLAGGVWLGEMARWFGLDLPVLCRPYQLLISERVPRLFDMFIGLASARLSLKQLSGGGVLIGGGWEGIGDHKRGSIGVLPAPLVGNLRLAHHAISAIAGLRLIRTWVGLEVEFADARPVIGALPGVEGVFINGGTRSGFTMAPYMGRLLAERMLGREAELPLFNPARLLRNDPPGKEQGPDSASGRPPVH
ncbi:MAG: FAD-binding oxidoreductase [Rhodospirillales bacterium]|jgi:glycine/D-amino acid oxidase-like deaminating enzyme|nr:FAD-binding oxidoreductase [Rhodospirillales bacterium]MDP7651433.1 FAD-binding oxidoreductase [Rhodospirillales bacterium]HJO96858.1 FAD-binding oxidoreductase [Rhodospirillales bacterium]